MRNTICESELEWRVHEVMHKYLAYLNMRLDEPEKPFVRAIYFEDDHFGRGKPGSYVTFKMEIGSE